LKLEKALPCYLYHGNFITNLDMRPGALDR
jgi:hypothetical protein